MASLVNAKKGDIVTLPGGKKIVSDGRGGGRVQRPKKKRVMPDSKPTKNKPVAKVRPVAGRTTGQGLRSMALRSLAKRGDTLAELIKQGKRK